MYISPRRLFLIVGLVLILLVGGVVFRGTFFNDVFLIHSFEECVEAGYPVAESYPRQCVTPDGLYFAENMVDLHSPEAKKDLIRVTRPQPDTVITSPLTIEGEARGTWFFEASFPVVLVDWDGLIIAEGHAEAQGEWMTENFVPFKATLTFSARGGSASGGKNPAHGERGTLILRKDNPSGLPEHDDALEFPIRFKVEKAPAPVETGRERGGCMITGCSGQVCGESDIITTCEYRPEYACYENTVCERQADGQCGWTLTAAVGRCLQELSPEAPQGEMLRE